jgi:hypothetical protein
MEVHAAYLLLFAESTAINQPDLKDYQLKAELDQVVHK